MISLSTFILRWWVKPLLIGSISAAASIFVTSLVYRVEIAEIKSGYDQKLISAQNEAKKAQKKFDDANAKLDAEGSKRLQDKENELIKLRNSVASGAVRLRVAARCSGLPKASSTASVGYETSPELDPTVRPAYFALRSGIVEQTEQLTTCQAILKGITE